MLLPVGFKDEIHELVKLAVPVVSSWLRFK